MFTILCIDFNHYQIIVNIKFLNEQLFLLFFAHGSNDWLMDTVYKEMAKSET